MKTFQYKKIIGNYLSEKELNKYGAKGWELIKVDSSDNFTQTCFIFKREKEEDRAKVFWEHLGDK